MNIRPTIPLAPRFPTRGHSLGFGLADGRGGAVVAVAIALLLALSAGCRRKTEAPASTESTAARTTVRVAMYEPKSIDPAQLFDGLGPRVAESLFEGLLSLDAAGKPIAGIAERWETSEDGRTWTFHLRDGLVWSDGKAFAASDVVWSLQRAVKKDTANPLASMLEPIAGAAAITAGTASPESLGVEAPDPRTVVIRLERPWADFPRLLARGPMLPVPKHVIEAHGERWTRPEHVVGNGPFRLVEHVHEERMALEKNPRYHAADSVALERVELRFTTSQQQGHHWYELDEVDWVDGLIPAHVVDTLRASSDDALRIDPYDGQFYLYLNASTPPFDDARVRRAVDLAIDRGRLVRQVLKGGETAAWSLIPPSLTGARPRPRPYAPERARALLTAAGYGPAKPFPEVELVFNSNDKNRKLAEFFQAELKRALGIVVTLRNVEWKTFLDDLTAGSYTMGQLNLGCFDALDCLGLLESDSPGNRSRWKSAVYDQLVDKVRVATTIAARDELIDEIYGLLDRERPLVPVFQMTRKALVRPGLMGFETTTDNRHPFRWMRWKDTP